MKISIFGLGYVGCVSAGCLSNNGHKVIGVDISQHKTDLINQGLPTIIEKNIDELIQKSHQAGMLSATTDFEHAVLNTDVSIICVGTPSSDTGKLNFDHIYQVAEQIGKSITNKNTFHVIVIRSTFQPGTHNKVAEIISKASSKIRNIDFAMVSNPEFLRESTAIEDYYNPAFTLLGSDSEKAFEIMEEIYKDINAPIYRTDYEVAEIIKYINNSFHALKITFGNEVGNICKTLGIDSHKVMDIFCKDDKLNISPYYFKPGFAYGGSCLPKDLGALIRLSRDLNLDTPVLESISKSNEIQKEILLNKILKENKKNIGILGLSFKAGTDDLRESPIVDVIERLIGKGFNVKIYDKNVSLSKLVGSNKSYIENKLPHLSKLITDLSTVINESELLVITNKEAEFNNAFKLIDKNNYQKEEGLELRNKIVIDLVRIAEAVNIEGKYDGICW